MKKSGNFFMCLLFNFLMNLGWTIPAWILLVLHFACDFSIMWFWIAMGVWFTGIAVLTVIIYLVSGVSMPDKPKENKNPYSVGYKKKSDELDKYSTWNKY